MNLWERMDRMVSYQPMFCDITWGAGGTTSGTRAGGPTPRGVAVLSARAPALTAPTAARTQR